ncbi:MAG: protein translocase subunit SecF [Myxococcales bacterium]|nr:protein translocase subunit SecF [Myxococcales bacterium]
MANENKPKHKFFELIKPNHNFEFVGRMNLLLAISLVLITVSLAMLPINHYWRGHTLNYGIDFRGGTEMQVQFSGEKDPAKIRAAMQSGGFHDAEVVRVKGTGLPNLYFLRFGAVSPVSEKKVQELEAAFRTRFGADAVKKFDFSEGGDKIYIRFNKNVEPSEVIEVFKSQGVQQNTVQRYGRPEENVFEVILVGLDVEVKAALEKGLGEGAVLSVPSVESVGAKAGAELRDDGIKSLLFAIVCIMVYIAVRFDFRYGPGTVAALLHDAILVMGAFAITYREFSLTTIAAILTVIGYSMNDTIVVFDRIRENASRMRDKKFDRLVNTSINETLSRTILTSATVFFVTLAMNIWGTGVIRDFAFAMNVGVIVGTYSSIFVAAPILIWLNRRFFKPEGKDLKKNPGKPNSSKKAPV